MGESTTPKSGDTWYVFTGGEVKGPYSRDDVLSLLRMGLVAADAQFLCGGKWINRAAFELAETLFDDGLAELEPLAAAEGGHVKATAPGPPEETSLDSSSAAGEQPESKPPDIPFASNPVRDRIVVIGRRAAGKTIYLAELYHQLWKSRDGFCMKALSGRSHKELMAVHETLCQGQWPAATDRTTVLQMEFEVQYRSQSRILVGLDYAGEVFRDAFVNDDTDSAPAKALISHIDRALAVILLIDPAVAVSNDADAMIDDDYGIVQAIQRIRDWPGGEDVPLVLLLTKADQNRKLFKNKKATRQFIEAHYPAMMRTLKHFKVFHVSAVQATTGGDGKSCPESEWVPQNLLESLKYCLDCLHADEEHKQIHEQQQAEQDAMQRMIEFQAESERGSNRRFITLIAALVTISVCLLVLLFVFLD